MLATRLALIGLLALALAACGGSKNSRPSGSRGGSGGSSSSSRGGRDDISKSQSSRYRSSSDSVPTDIPDVSKLPEPVPKVEPRALYGNKSPYSVLGQTYNVLPTPRGYVERGIASFYGNKFHGYKTSSLEEYDMYQFSAAHKTLPLPSYARVTNLENGKSVIVRINDRGPFHENRIIDLSFAAAVKLGVWPKGTGLVEVRAIDPTEANGDRGAPYVNTAPKPAPVTAPAPPPRPAFAAAPPAARTAPTPDMATSPPSTPSRFAAAAPVGATPVVAGATRAPSAAIAAPVGTTVPVRATPVATASAGDENDGPVPGMTGVSAAEALPPLPGAKPATAPATPASTPRPATPAQGPVIASVPGKPSIYLQVGAFSDVANANRVADRLNKAGLGPVSVIETAIGGHSVRRVRVGPLADVDSADRVTDQISGMGLPRPQVAVD
ncbi:MAG TPA: septal ring lytic transglycosylase RlpA family protein [Luteibacter sp.]|uniref:septal ring lytic transglycosylase RlpA family protein n=1 Tax=Luteibacter sp. TaxID=1886636 RepID=UPI002B945782|nr:septal ring lytic transglycosylase RlpA family protein [Luteibacter sp.]HVI55908.1 septal ring lytic transglycosylase RlpA family protein [Luteibacter sp.]